MKMQQHQQLVDQLDPILKKLIYLKKLWDLIRQVLVPTVDSLGVSWLILVGTELI
jgi:hypothetical protein